jgi:uncharacterized protein YciI
MSRLAFVTLRYRDRAVASRHLAGHQAWLRAGFAQGRILLAGGLDDDDGGGILMRADDPEALAALVADDPFVAHGVVDATITAMTAARADQRLEWLLDEVHGA